MTAGGYVTADAIDEAIAWRRDLHRHPELAFNEKRTSELIASQLARFGLNVHRGLAGTGVVGTLSRGTSRRVIGIRADMDALALSEESQVPHSSEHRGIMHACGHDGHVAMALAAARACAGLSHLDGTVHFIFQPAEENEGGGKRMIEDGLFRLFPCDSIYALHNWPSLPIGGIVAHDGAMMAAFATFEITLTGKGCHAAMPHEGIDPILTACQLTSALQSIVSRNIEPAAAAVLSITQIHAGESWNVIPAACHLKGTARWFDEEAGKSLQARLALMTGHIASSYGCIAKTSYTHRYPATINHEHAAALVRRVAATPALNFKVLERSPSLSSEDFAFMLEKVPGCYFWLGTGREQGSPRLHSPGYDFNDEALPLGANLWVALVEECLRAR